MPNFIAIALRGALALKYVKYYAFVTFYCPVLSWLYFVSRNRAHSGNPWMDFNSLWLKWRALSPRDVTFGGFDDDPQF